MAILSVNPATEEVLERFEPFDADRIQAALELADETFQRYRRSGYSERARAMNAAARVLENEKSRLAPLLTEEMGKTLAAATAEIEKCAWVCRYYAQNAERFLSDEPRESDASRSFTRYLPIGPVLAVMPWNFPFWQVFRFAAPALVAGNVGLLKHASNVPRCAMAIEDVLRRAGFPEGCFQTLLVRSEEVDAIIRDERVRAATLTGSEGAGAAVAAAAGGALKKTVLELGGSDPFLVMPSADVGAAVEAAVKGRMINNGQSCIAAKRFIVHQEIFDDFSERLVKKVASLTIGDPMKQETDIGPLATRQVLDDVDEQVRLSVEAGAERLTGAEPIDGPGYFYRPGVLSEVPEDAPAFADEVFGPVAALFRAESLSEAIELGNATRFGLGSAIFTQDADEMQEAADGLDAGATFVNSIVASDPRLPFGGVRSSGYGRELAREGIREFVNCKTISIA